MSFQRVQDWGAVKLHLKYKGKKKNHTKLLEEGFEFGRVNDPRREKVLQDFPAFFCSDKHWVENSTANH